MTGRCCEIAECERPHEARGMCKSHYNAWRKTQIRAQGSRRKSQSPDKATRLIMDAARSASAAHCILWPYYRDTDGYGRVMGEFERYAVHRRVCELVNGAAPPEKPLALHTCNNGHLGCFNPHHLRWGSRHDNAADMALAGTRTRGTACGGLLTDDQVAEIRTLHGTEHAQLTAARFGVSSRTILRVQSRQTYTHLLWKAGRSLTNGPDVF